MITALIFGVIGVAFALFWGLFHKFQFFVIQGGMINSGIFGLCIIGTFNGVVNIFSDGSGWWWVLVVGCLGMSAISAFNLWHYYLGHEDRELKSAQVKAIKDSLPEDIRDNL